MDGEFIHYWDSPLGRLTLTSDGEALTGLYFEMQKCFDHADYVQGGEKEPPVFASADRWLSIYFGGGKPDFVPPLHLRGTAFRKAVWDILLTIPFGQTMSYKEIAQKIAKQRGIVRMSAQAVGGAVGHNPVSIIVPCHRVIGTDGNLTGYAGGLDIKEKLLMLEGAKVKIKAGRLTKCE